MLENYLIKHIFVYILFTKFFAYIWDVYKRQTVDHSKNGPVKRALQNPQVPGSLESSDPDCKQIVLDL